MRARRLLALAAAVLTIGVPAVQAAGPVFLKDFRLHDFDQGIMRLLGYDVGSVLYFREMGSITEEQRRERAAHEPVGCNPYYVMQNGQPAEKGYNCRSFVCVGYIKGPKQCMDIQAKPYGGVVEINKRLGLVTINDVRKLFTEYAPADRTAYMNARIEELQLIRCEPFYLQEFDVVVGEGYQCKEIGKFPNYSGTFSCVNDARKKDGLVCSIPLRPKELDFRAQLMAASGSVVGPISSVPSDSSSSIASSSSSSVEAVTFPDVEQGKYGYTAILSLASRGIIKGYPDGTFRPKTTVNRAEFAHLLVTSLHPEERKGDAWCFPDAVADWYAEAVCASKRLGWVGGYPDGKYHPERTIKKSEAIKIIIASLSLPIASSAPLPVGVQDDAWYSPYIRKAVELKILLEPTFYPESEVTRADTAVWLYRALKISEAK